MKHTITSLLAALLVVSAAAQNTDTTSTVVGKKLNFEAPLFGVSVRNLRPTWSVAAFDEATMGWNYFFGAPTQIKPSGLYAELSMLSLRYRPWRDENLFTVALLTGVNMHRAQSGFAFGNDGSIIPVPAGWANAKSYFYEEFVGLQMGYVREFGAWKGGLFVMPGYGTTQLRNTYILDGISGISHIDQLNANNGFRMGFKAGLWYQDLGVAVTYKPVIGGASATVPMYNSVSVGISVRY